MAITNISPNSLSLGKPKMVGRCPKCKGQLFLNKDKYGQFKECLSCGFMQDIQTQPVDWREKYRKYLPNK